MLAIVLALLSWLYFKLTQNAGAAMTPDPTARRRTRGHRAASCSAPSPSGERIVEVAAERGIVSDYERKRRGAGRA